MCLRMALPTPRRLAVSAVCMDFTSPWVASSGFMAPVPSRVSLSQAAQKSISVAARRVTSKTWALPGGVTSWHLSKW